MQSEIFPWAEVEICKNDAELQAVKNESKMIYLSTARQCPLCGKEPADLAWICFMSPPVVWENLAGRLGWLTVCEDCHMQVDFFVELMNLAKCPAIRLIPMRTLNENLIRCDATGKRRMG